MIDLHTHILPGVDDGVKTEDEAVEFARMSWNDGVRVIVATPHCRDGFFVIGRTEMLAAVERLRARLTQEGIETRIEPGAEVHLAPELPERIRDGRAPTLADNGRTLLLELSLSQYPVGVENILFQLKLAGIEVVFAHPERIRYFQDDPKRWEEFVRMGAYGQITTGSILGTFGTDTAEFSKELLRKGQVHVIASDAHNLRGRPPLMTEARAAAAAMVGEARAACMTEQVPSALLTGEKPQLPAVESASPVRRSFLSRWFRSD